MKDYKILDLIAFILVIIGGINWLLIGAVRLDLVAFLFGEHSLLSRVIYILVGLAAVFLVYIKIKNKASL